MALYQALASPRVAPWSVMLNRAVAIGLTDGPAAGLAAINEIDVLALPVLSVRALL
jgi:predicted RNA polymerase sigma factor